MTEYCERYAKNGKSAAEEEDESGEEDISDGNYSSDDEIPGHADLWARDIHRLGFFTILGSITIMLFQAPNVDLVIDHETLFKTCTIPKNCSCITLGIQNIVIPKV